MRVTFSLVRRFYFAGNNSASHSREQFLSEKTLQILEFSLCDFLAPFALFAFKLPAVKSAVFYFVFRLCF
jgi:hypothetical protein